MSSTEPTDEIIMSVYVLCVLDQLFHRTTIIDLTVYCCNSNLANHSRLCIQSFEVDTISYILTAEKNVCLPRTNFHLSSQNPYKIESKMPRPKKTDSSAPNQQPVSKQKRTRNTAKKLKENEIDPTDFIESPISKKTKSSPESELDILSSTILDGDNLQDNAHTLRRRFSEEFLCIVSTDDTSANEPNSENEPLPPKKSKAWAPRKQKLRPEDARTLEVLSEKFKAHENGIKCLVDKCSSKVLQCSKPSNLKRHLAQRHRSVFASLFPNEIDTKKHAELEAFNALQDAIELVTVNGYPFSMLNASGMRGFVKARLKSIRSEGYFLSLNRCSIVEHVANESNLIRKYIANELKGKTISIMFDVCTITTLSMLGMNVTFMKDSNVVCWSVGTIQIDERHTAVNLANMIFDILAEFDISIANVLSITSDTAKNAIATAKVLDAVAKTNESSGDIVDDSIFDIGPHDDGLAYGIDIENAAELQMVIDNADAHSKLVKNMADNIVAQNTSIVHINQINCGTHVFQLAVNDALNVSDSQSIISRVHNMCVLMRTQIVMIEIRKLGCQVILPPMENSTRWFSKFMMVSICIKKFQY